MLEQQARNQNRHGAENNEPAHLGIRIVCAHTAFEVLALLAEQGAKPSTENTDDVVTEIQNDGKLGANLNNGGKRGTRVRASIKSPMMRIWALEETGRYSVNACTSPRKIAWKKFMNPLLYVSMVSSAFPHPRLARGV